MHTKQKTEHKNGIKRLICKIIELAFLCLKMSKNVENLRFTELFTEP